jgi:hypothetical protein
MVRKSDNWIGHRKYLDMRPEEKASFNVKIMLHLLKLIDEGWSPTYAVGMASRELDVASTIIYRIYLQEKGDLSRDSRSILYGDTK